MNDNKIPEEMLKLRNVLNSRGVVWYDRTEKPSFSLLDLTIYRTWFIHKGKEWLVSCGYPITDTLEVRIEDYNRVGNLTAQDVLLMMDD